MRICVLEVAILCLNITCVVRQWRLDFMFYLNCDFVKIFLIWFAYILNISIELISLMMFFISMEDLGPFNVKLLALIS